MVLGPGPRTVGEDKKRVLLKVRCQHREPANALSASAY